MLRDPPTGLLASARRLFATLLELGQVRLELLGVEIEDQKRRIISASIWAATGLVLLGAALVVLAAGILAYFWEVARWTAWASLLALYLTAGALALRQSFVRLRTEGGAFSASVAELARDRHALGSSNGLPPA